MPHGIDPPPPPHGDYWGGGLWCLDNGSLQDVYKRQHKHRELRIEVQAVYQNKESTPALSSLVQYVAAAGGEVVFRFVPDATDASDEERKTGIMERTLRISVTYREAQRMVRKARSIRFSMRLNSEKIVRRVPAHLGKILGLTPRSMK